MHATSAGNGACGCVYNCSTAAMLHMMQCEGFRRRCCVLITAVGCKQDAKTLLDNRFGGNGCNRPSAQPLLTEDALATATAGPLLLVATLLLLDAVGPLPTAALSDLDSAAPDPWLTALDCD